MVECYLYFNECDAGALALFKCLREIRSPKLKLLLSDVVYNEWSKSPGLYAYDVEKASNKKGTYCICFRWDVNSLNVVPLYTDDVRGLVNFMAVNPGSVFCIYDSDSYSKNTYTLFRDIINIQDFPDAFYKLNSFSAPQSVLDYFKGKGVIPNFSLEGNDSFELTGISPVQGSLVYRERSTGYLWYLDNLHKTHFEVFDSLGKKHIGEASIEGKLDRSKVDIRKRPIIK